jgi:cation:H+ antiporter
MKIERLVRARQGVEINLMLPAFFAIIFGLALLVWSADWFVDGAASVARRFGMRPLLVGMVIVGFGTSAPEMAVSAIAAAQGNFGLALGNVYGSNITNIALILGLTAMISPIAVHSQVLRKELPILIGITALAAWQAWDGEITRYEALVLLGVFGGLMAWIIRQGLRESSETPSSEATREQEVRVRPMQRALIRLVVGLAFLIGSSRILVWGAVELAHRCGVSDLVIGLTVVAVGTSLPELATSLVAMRKKEHDLALGNVLGSNLFNTLAVTGVAGTIHPLTAAPEIFYRDIPVMAALTVSLFFIGYGFRRPGRINRLEGAALLVCFAGYTVYLLFDVL